MAKRKVQAQRKFAQGAFVPPSSSTIKNFVEKRLDGASKETKTIYNSMSAKSLLDIVSLKTLHHHLQPYVLLERIEARDNNEKSLRPPRSKSCVMRHASTKMTYDNNMQLRSRVVVHKISKKPNTEVKKSKLNHLISHFSIEDNKPLKYFASNPTQNDTKDIVSTVKKRKKRPVRWTARKSSTISKTNHAAKRIKTISRNINLSKMYQKSKKAEAKVKCVQPLIQPVEEISIPGPSTWHPTTPPYTSSGSLHQPNNNDDSDTDDMILLYPFDEPMTDEITHNIPNNEPTITDVLSMGPALNVTSSQTDAAENTETVEKQSSLQYNEPTISDIYSMEPTNVTSSQTDAAENPKTVEKQSSLQYNEPTNSDIYSMGPTLNVTSSQTDAAENPKTVEKQSSLQYNEPTNSDIYSMGPTLKVTSSQTDAAENTETVEKKCLFQSVTDENTPKVIDCRSESSVTTVRLQTKTLTQVNTPINEMCELNNSEINVDRRVDNDSIQYYENIRIRKWITSQQQLNSPSSSMMVNPPSPELLPNSTTICSPSVFPQSTVNCLSSELLPKQRNMRHLTLNTDVKPVTISDSSEDTCGLLNLTEKSGKPSKRGFPKSLDHAKLVDAPIFYPTLEEFLDPVAYFDKIIPTAAKFGICKVVAPEGFKPSCHMNDNFKFSVSNQYISRLYNRWSPVTREMCAIKCYSASQNVIFSKAPLVEGLEVNLPKLYHLVQRLGGLQTVIRKKRWSRVAEEMRFTKGPNPGHKLDLVYVKYLLPYDTLSHQERQKIVCRVEKSWQKKNQKMLERALNPLQRQKRLLGESDETESSDDDTEDEYSSLADAEDCVVAGRPMNLKNFKKVASNAMDTYFPRTSLPTKDEVEKEYWRVVLLNTDHVCVNTASIDTGVEGYGFTNVEDDPYSKHPWNLKVISNNSGNVLRSLGRVLGVTVPTLHLGMVFSTSCWHRDPHGLPWIEYMHNGPGKIWYGIPDEQSNNFRKAVEKLCPTSCQNKSIWLPSDITMIPPSLLLESNVSLSKVHQRPGEFIIVFPKAYSSSLSMGFTQSESVYFATKTWLNTIHQVFQEARDSCEPTMFAVEQLLIAVARDPRSQLSVLQQVHTNLKPILDQELEFRRSVEFYNIRVKQVDEAHRDHNTKRTTGSFNVRDLDECQICRTTLYLSKVTGVTGKKSTVCLQHTLCLLDKQETVNPNNLELIVYYTNQELELIIDNLQKRIMPTMNTHPRWSLAGPSTAP